MAPDRAETTERVVATAAELGYIVNAVASSMRSQQTRTVGLILADVSNPWWGQLTCGVESILGPEGFSVILANTDNRVERERAAVETLLRKQVDALVIASSSATEATCAAPSRAAPRSSSSMRSCRTWTSTPSPSTTKLPRTPRSRTCSSSATRT